MDVRDATVRQRLALLGIVLAVAGAIWGVVEVAGSSDTYGSYTVLSKLLPTVVAAVLFSLVIGSGVRLAERQKSLAPVGFLTVLLGLIAFAAAVRQSFWHGLSGDPNLAESLWIAAIASGQISLLLSWPRRGDRGPAMATAVLGSLATTALAVATVVEIANQGSDVSRELVGILMVAYLLGLVLVPLVDLATRREPGTAAPADLLTLDHASLLATDPTAAARFYESLLGAEAGPSRDSAIALSVGPQMQVEGFDRSASEPHEAGRIGTVGLCFVWPGSSESALEMLRTIGAATISGPIQTTGALGAAESVSCRDPEGNLVELISYRD